MPEAPSLEITEPFSSYLFFKFSDNSPETNLNPFRIFIQIIFTWANCLDEMPCAEEVGTG